MPPRALILKEPWASKVVSGEKTIELRTMKTNKIGEEIYIAKAGTKTLIGKVTIDKCLLLSQEEFKALESYHMAGTYAATLNGKKIYGWFLKNAIAFENPIPYSHPQGAQIWVVLS